MEQERFSLSSEEAALIVRDHYFDALEWLPAQETARLRADCRTRLEWMELECGRELQATILPVQGNIERVRLMIRPLLGQEIAWRATDRQTLSARKISEDAILDQKNGSSIFNVPCAVPSLASPPCLR